MKWLATAMLAILLAGIGEARSELGRATDDCVRAAVSNNRLMSGTLHGQKAFYLECTGGVAARLYTVLHRRGYKVVEAHTSNDETGYKIIFGKSMCQWLREDEYGDEMDFTGCYLWVDIGEDAARRY